MGVLGGVVSHQRTNAWSLVLAGGFSPVPSTAGTGEGLLLQALLPPQRWEMSPSGTQAPMGGFGAEFLLSPCSSWPCKKQLSLGLCLHGSGAHGESCSWPSAINSSLCQENILREETTPEGVNGGMAGAVRAAARAPIPSHPIPSHPIPSHPIPSHPICPLRMGDGFLLLRAFLPLQNQLQAHTRQQQGQAKLPAGWKPALRPAGSGHCLHAPFQARFSAAAVETSVTC